MIYFCADDYGISTESNRRIERCLSDGVLNKISVLPNGETTDITKLTSYADMKISLHINLVEGYPLSNPKDVDLIIAEDGSFKYSFIGLFLLSFSSKRRKIEQQIYTELQNQLRFWKMVVGEQVPFSIDSHQHAYMVPFIFKILLQVIRDEQITVNSMRIPAEPITPYIFAPSLYGKYRPQGIIKQWLLNFLAWVNRKAIKRSHIPFDYFMGAMFSGTMTEDKIKALLPRYLKLAQKHGKEIEIALHPGYVKQDEALIGGSRSGFRNFYFSPWRNAEFDTLIKFKW